MGLHDSGFLNALIDLLTHCRAKIRRGGIQERSGGILFPPGCVAVPLLTDSSANCCPHQALEKPRSLTICPSEVSSARRRCLGQAILCRRRVAHQLVFSSSPTHSTAYRFLPVPITIHLRFSRCCTHVFLPPIGFGSSAASTRGEGRLEFLCVSRPRSPAFASIPSLHRQERHPELLLSPSLSRGIRFVTTDNDFWLTQFVAPIVHSSQSFFFWR
jgi:hypothetical protein